MDEDIEIGIFVTFSIWVQNFFCITVPVVGALLGGWPGFFIGTGVSLLVFFIVSGAVGAFDA